MLRPLLGGETALGTTLAILRQKPEVVLLDVRMPGLAGDKLASLIEQKATARPIVILHSSLPIDHLERLVRSTGAAGYVPKGSNPKTFLGEFERVVADAQRRLARKQA